MTGPHRERTRRGMARRVPAGRGKPASEGLTFLPAPGEAALKALLAERGLSGLPVALCLLRMSGAEWHRSQVEASHVESFGSDDELQASWDLPEDQPSLAGALEALTRVRGKGARWVSDVLADEITPALRKRLLPEQAWAVHLRITVALLHRVADAAAVAALRERPDWLRAWRRSPWADADEMTPPTTAEVASAYETGEAPFWGVVEAKLTDEDRATLAGLG